MSLQEIEELYVQLRELQHENAELREALQEATSILLSVANWQGEDRWRPRARQWFKKHSEALVPKA